MKKILYRIAKPLLCLFCLIPALFLCANAAAQDTEGAAGQVKVPLIIQLPHAIAGAEFKFSYTEGLEFVSFEKSEAIQSALTTPVVERDGSSYLGFFTGDNSCVPENGELHAGYLIFNYSGAPSQSVTLAEAKLVELVDKDTTTSEVLAVNKKIGVPLSDSAALVVGAQPQWVWIIIPAGALLLICMVAFIIVRKRKLSKADTPQCVA
jgi:uncharacterized integral membrane protein